MRKKGTIVVVAVVVSSLLLMVVGFFVFFNREQKESVANFEECITAGYPVMESYPRQCRDGEGNLHVEDIEYPYGPEG